MDKILTTIIRLGMVAIFVSAIVFFWSTEWPWYLSTCATGALCASAALFLVAIRAAAKAWLDENDKKGE